MGRDLNKVMIIGRLERDPEMRYTPRGSPVTSFSVATVHNWVSSSGERHEETEWFSVVAWGALATICYDHLQKGKQVYVEGRLKTRSWQDGDGRRHYRTEVVANEMIVLGDRANSSYASSSGDGEFEVRSDDSFETFDEE